MALDNNYTGITKLKDWWGKVKANFAYLDDRISTIITTPVDGVSAQEIIDARKGETALGDKIDAMDAITNAHLAEIIDARKGETALGDKIDAMDAITNAHLAEIIDARKGETALGDKIDAMDAITNAHLAESAHWVGFYNANDPSTTYYSIGIAKSADNVRFSRSATPVLKPRANVYDSGGMNAPCPVLVGNFIYLYFSALNPATSKWHALGLAILTKDGQVVRRSREPILTLGSSGAWDDSKIYRPFVMYDAEEVDANKCFKMMYNGANAAGVNRGGVAYSPDGIVWTKYSGNPIFDVNTSGEWDDAWVFPEYVIKKDGLFHMVYNGYDGLTTIKTGHATASAFEGPWTRNQGNPILTNRSIATQNITANVTVGSKTVTVADTSVFEIDEPCYLTSSAGTENVRVKSKVSGTVIELYEPIMFAHTTANSGALKSIFSAAVGSNQLAFEDGKWKIWGSTWMVVSGFETTFYAEGDTIETLQIQYAKSPTLNYDTTNPAEWDSRSQENMKFVKVFG